LRHGYSYHIVYFGGDSDEGVVYKAYTNGTIVDPKGKVVGTHGIDAFDATLQPQFLIVDFSDDQIFHVYPSGKVTDDEGKTILEEGGLEKLIEEFHKDHAHGESVTTFKFSDILFHILRNGSITDEEGNLVFKTGGVDRLYSHIARNIAIMRDNDDHKYYLVYPGGGIHALDGEKIADSWQDFLQYKLAKTLVDESEEIHNGHLVKVALNQTVSTKGGLVLSQRGL